MPSLCTDGRLFLFFISSKDSKENAVCRTNATWSLDFDFDFDFELDKEEEEEREREKKRPVDESESLWALDRNKSLECCENEERGGGQRKRRWNIFAFFYRSARCAFAPTTIGAASSVHR